MQAQLYHDAGIPVTVVSDASVAAVMERVDMVLVGAEAVVESGGIVNRTGGDHPIAADYCSSVGQAHINSGLFALH